MTTTSLTEPISLTSLLKSFESGDDSKLVRVLRKMNDEALDYALESAQRLHKFSWWLLANVVAERMRRIKPEKGGRGKKAAPGKGRGAEIKRLKEATGYSERWLWQMYAVVEVFGSEVPAARSAKTWKVSKAEDKGDRVDELRALQVRNKIFRPHSVLASEHYVAALSLRKFPGAPQDLIEATVAKVQAGVKVTPAQVRLQAERIKNRKTIDDFVAFGDKQVERYEFSAPRVVSGKLAAIGLKLKCGSLADTIVEAVDLAYQALGLEDEAESLALESGEWILPKRKLEKPELRRGLYDKNSFLDHRQKIVEHKKRKKQSGK